jgi:glycosyltransferase involved in cell wall biosynthesis
MHKAINGLSMGSGGGYTVGIELFRNIALARPAWKVTLAVITGNALHEETKSLALPSNCSLLWAPASTANIRTRMAYERGEFAAWARSNQVSAILQLNGMIIPGIGIPTVAHCQDPWPYRPEAWDKKADAIKAFLKRRANKQAFRQAAFVGWTSGYLKDLMCGRLGITPKNGGVIYNGIPDEWVKQAQTAVPPYAGRPMDIVTISNVAPYKQQEMVIRAMPELLKRPGLAKLKYRIAGHCPPAYAAYLKQLAAELGVADAVVLEGRVSRERIVELFSTARCYVLMSKCESFGLPAIEAMAFGTPVIAADCCAIPEVCGKAAQLCGMDDLSGLVNTIAKVVLDSELAEQMRRAGLNTLQRYSWAKAGAQMAEALDSITKTNGH